jgi:tetratricopeptide (TPR) repeat protein
VAIPDDLPGRTLLPVSERTAGTPRPSYFEAMSSMLNRGWAPLRGVLADRDKFIDVPIVERYDLAADPAETTNLIGRAPERDRTLSASLRAFNAVLPGQRRSEDPEAAARLRSLGYVAGDAPIKAHYTEADDPKALIAIDQAVHRGVDLYTARRFDEAMATYRGIIAQRSDMAIAYRHLAFVAWETGQTMMAIDTLKKAIASGVTSSGIVTQLGTYLAESGDARAAIPLLEPLASADGADPDALNGLGIAFARAGRPADARRVFERMLSADPSSAMALSNLAALDLERADFAAARTRFERAASLDPTSSAAQAGLGVVAIKSGNPRLAIEAWRRAVELDPSNYDALFNLATTLVQTDGVAAARPYLEQFARNAPSALYGRDIAEVQRLLQR